MNRRTTDSSSRTSTSMFASLIFFSLCYSANSWLTFSPTSPHFRAISMTGRNSLSSSPPSSACPPEEVGFAWARRSIYTTHARYAGGGDNYGEDYASLTSSGDDTQDEGGLLFSANSTTAVCNDGSSGSSSNSNKFGASENASDIRPNALCEGERNVLETSRDHQQSAETAIEEGHFQGALAEATEIMASRGESDALSALRAYRLLSDARDATHLKGVRAYRLLSAKRDATHLNGGDAQLSLLAKATAAALLSWIRCKTDGNGLVITDVGDVTTSDTAERQELWAVHAPTVLKLLAEVGKEPASDPELQQLYTEAMMYSASSQGVLKAFVTGQAFLFESKISALVEKFPEQDNGVAYIFQGSYFLVAPWPIRSPLKARESFEKAVKVNGCSRRNLYYAGVGRLACGDRDGAAEMFRRAASDEDCESASAIERDIATVLREQSQRGLAVCERDTIA